MDPAERLAELQQAVQRGDAEAPTAGRALAQELRQQSRPLAEIHAVYACLQSAGLPLGADAWLDWIREMDGDTVGMCRAAVTETYSAVLWEAVLDKCVKPDKGGVDEEEDDDDEEDDDRIELVQQGLAATRYDLANSARVWRRYLLLRYGFTSVDDTTDEAVLELVKVQFDDRIGVPHVGMEETFSEYSSLVTRLYPAAYERMMSEANAEYNSARSELASREMAELRMARGVAQSLQCYEEYLDTETNPTFKHVLFERAVSSHPEAYQLWERYASFLAAHHADAADGDVTWTLLPHATPLDALQHAVAWCPTRGALWADLFYELATQGPEVPEMRALIDRAAKLRTLSGDEWLKMACGAGNALVVLTELADNDAVVNNSCVETLQKLDKKYFFDFIKKQKVAAESQYMLSLTLIKLYSTTSRVHDARTQWKRLKRAHCTEHAFWLQYYMWTAAHEPDSALSVLQEAFGYALDDPRPLDAVVRFVCSGSGISEQHYEQTRLLRASDAYCRAWLEAQIGAAEHVEEPLSEAVKRPAESLDGTDETPPAKRAKSHSRDREHDTLIVSGLPLETTKEDVSTLFRDCGNVISIALVSADHGSSALVEFETRDDLLAGLTRDHKQVRDKEVRVYTAEGTDLFVTNFDPLMDQGALRDLFSPYGTVLDVRMPSLRVKSSRRFCYVQMQSPQGATVAMSALDGLDMGANRRLVVKISDPSRRQSRSGPVEEKREVYVRNVAFSVSQDELYDFFSSKLGADTIESVRLPLKPPVNRFNLGYAYVTFVSAEAASQAVDISGSVLRDRMLLVTLSEHQGRSSQRSQALKGGHREAEQADTRGDADLGLRIRNKSIGVIGLPSTVSQVRLKAEFAKHGTVVRVSMHPERGGAIVEFENVNDAGRAQMAEEGTVMDGQAISVISVHDMMQRPAQELPASSPAFRPRQRLGFARTTAQAPRQNNAGSSLNAGINAQNDQDETKNTGGGKSNADFRALLNGA